MNCSKIILFIGLFYSTIAFGEPLEKDTTLEQIVRIKDISKRLNAFNETIENCWRIGEYEKGLTYSSKALILCKSGKYPKQEAILFNNIGIISDYQGNYSKAMTFYFKALQLFEQEKDENGEAYTLSNIGLIYSNQKNYTSSLAYHYKSLRLRKKIKSIRGISASYNNIGICYMYQKKYNQAIDNYLSAIRIDEQIKDTFGLSDDYNNIGICYMETNQFPLAMDYFQRALTIRIQFNDQLGIATSHTNIGTLLFKQEQNQAAAFHFKKAIAIGESIGVKETLRYSYDYLHQIYSKLGQPKEALEAYKISIAYSDSLSNDENTKQQTEIEMRFAFDKQLAKQNLIQTRKNILAKKEKETTWLILLSICIVLIIIICFSVLLFRRWKMVNKQKHIIEDKNRLVELKNEEILDSITYAKRIQTAILPSKSRMDEFLPNHFVVYQPKDIVAGDFYWMETTAETVFIAAADCTGHGVPGAMMSVVCNNALNRSVREFGLKRPADILDKTRELIVAEWEKGDVYVSDGMDISLCAIDQNSKQIQWAGANNSLWYLQNKQNGIVEIKPNKQPIGNYHHSKPFEQHEITFETGDRFFLFTDGFADQFGGPLSKKFMSKNFKTLLESLITKPIEEHAAFISETFQNWKGNLEQVDDVCIIGLEMK